MSFNPVDILTQSGHLRESWFRLMNKLMASFGDLGFDHVYYVDENEGVNASAQHGSYDRKYATIQAALNAAATDGFDEAIVLVGPGEYPEAVTLPDTLVSLTLMGLDPERTIINPAAGAAVTYEATAASVTQSLTIANLKLDPQAALGALNLSIDGTNAAAQDVCQNDWLTLKNLILGADFGTGVAIDCVNEVFMDDLKGRTPATPVDLIINNCHQVIGSNLLFADASFDYDTGEQVPAAGRGNYVFSNAVFATTTCDNLVQCYFGADTNITTLAGTIVGAAGPISGFIEAPCRIGAIDITFDVDVCAQAMEILNINQAKVIGTVSVAGTGVQDTAYGVVRARSAVFYDETQGDIVWGQDTNVHMEDAFFAIDAIDARNSHGVNRTHHLQKITVTNAQASIDIVNNVGDFPFLDDDFVVTFEDGNNAGAGALAITQNAGIAFGNKTVSTFDVLGSVAGPSYGWAVIHHGWNANDPEA